MAAHEFVAHLTFPNGLNASPHSNRGSSLLAGEYPSGQYPDQYDFMKLFAPALDEGPPPLPGEVATPAKVVGSGIFGSKTNIHEVRRANANYPSKEAAYKWVQEVKR